MPSSPPRRRTPAPFLSRASRRCRWPRPSAWRRRPPRVEVDRHHRIGAYGRGLCGHVLEGMLLGITQGLLVAAGASADDIAYPREDVAEQVGADDGIAGDDALVLDDPAAFDSIGGDDQHRCILPAERPPAYRACNGARMLQDARRSEEH